MSDVAVAQSEPVTAELRHTARTTGLLYLGLAVTGALGSAVLRGQVFADDDPAGTLANLTDEGLARLTIAVEFGIVVFPALTAVWFYRPFRSVDTFAAAALMAFGMVNAVAILVSAALLATALDVSNDATLAAPGGTAATVQLLYVASGHLRGFGGLFFGLWLISVGWLVLRSHWLPRLLVVGGAGYVISAIIIGVRKHHSGREEASERV